MSREGATGEGATREEGATRDGRPYGSDVLSAIYLDHLADDVASLIRTEKGDEVGYIGGLSHPAAGSASLARRFSE